MVRYPNPFIPGTKQDYFVYKQFAPEELWRKAFETLLSERKNWFNVKTLAKREDGIEDDTHKIVEENDMDTNSTVFYQMELRDDMASNFHRFGFTVEEIEKVLGR